MLPRMVCGLRPGATLPQAASRAPVVLAHSTIVEEQNDLGGLIDDFRDSMPGQDSNGYRDPDEVEAAQCLAAVSAALRGDLRVAAGLLDPLDYGLTIVHDARADGWHLLLRERQPYRRGWGLWLFNLSPTARDLIVEVPHPLWDQLTPELALEAYVRLGARALLLAGTHRYANGQPSLISDMARNPRSIFQHLHEWLAGVETHVLQYHGFNRKNRPGYPGVVLSDGGPAGHAGLWALRAALEARGESAGVYDGVNWSSLGATQNPQGRHSRTIGGRFYHLEHCHAIRATPERRAIVVAATLAALFA